MSRRIYLWPVLAVAAICLGLSPPGAWAGYEITVYDNGSEVGSSTNASFSGSVGTVGKQNYIAFSVGSVTVGANSLNIGANGIYIEAAYQTNTANDITIVVSATGFTSPASGNLTLTSTANENSANTFTGTLESQSYLNNGGLTTTSTDPSGTANGLLGSTGNLKGTNSGFSLGSATSTTFDASSGYAITDIFTLDLNATDCNVYMAGTNTVSAATVTTPAPVGGILLASGLPMMLLGGLFLRRKGQPLAV